METLRVLISLHKGYGVGDAVQISAVLQHLRKYRSNWFIDYCAEEGKHQVGRGIVENTFAYGQQYPSEHYDIEVQIILYDSWPNFHDRPNTRVATTLRDRFGLDWDAECGRYVVNVSERIKKDTELFLKGGRWVAVHYQGDSSPDRKNLSHEQANEICYGIWKLGYSPLLLDFRGRSPLEWTKITQLQGNGGNIEYVCGLISNCKAFIGIDSGPGKCASATSTPALVIWTGHHPAPFHDPASNTTHLVPQGYEGLFPIVDDPQVIEWFESHYRVRYYSSDPVPEVKKWLREVLQ